tara:strand:+ start:128 stop:670 length:543 start_codon:yes stop_codon:yes gene_type:complete
MQTNFLEPVASPQASVSQNVGMTKIEIYYSSPRVKGRTIFGDLVPYDKLWRAGANGPTSVVFSTSVKIGGEVLRAGKYSIAMTPSEKGNWKIDFNKAVKYPYAYMKDGKMDMESYNNDLALSIDVEPTLWDNNIERLFYRIDANDNKVANVIMLWSNVIVGFQVDTMPEDHIERFNKRLK